MDKLIASWLERQQNRTDLERKTMILKWFFIYPFGGLAALWLFAGINYIYESHHDAQAAVTVQQVRAVPVRELVEHFNACVQNYTRSAHPISMEIAEQRCNCAGEYLAANGYGEASLKGAQKACAMEMVSR